MSSSIFRQLIPKALNISAGLACSIFIGQTYGATELATYVYVISFINIFAVISLLGFELSMTEGIRKNLITSSELKAGIFFVITTSTLVCVFIYALDHFASLDLINPPLAATLVLVSTAYFLSNLTKFWNIGIYELIRGGGLNSALIILLIASYYLFPNNFLFYEALIASGFLLLSVSAFFAIKKIRHIDRNIPWGIRGYISRSMGLGFTAVFSSIIVTGEMIIAQPFVNESDLGNLAVLTRLSFAMGVIFILLNNNHTVCLAQGAPANSSYFSTLKKNLIPAIGSSLLGFLFFEEYFSVFVRDFPAHTLTTVIYALLFAHFVNILSAGALPFIALLHPERLTLITLFGVCFFFIALLISAFFLGKNLTSFCIAFYGSLLTYKATIIFYSFKLNKTGSKNDSF